MRFDKIFAYIILIGLSISLAHIQEVSGNNELGLNRIAGTWYGVAIRTDLINVSRSQSCVTVKVEVLTQSSFSVDEMINLNGQLRRTYIATADDEDTFAPRVFSLRDYPIAGTTLLISENCYPPCYEMWLWITSSGTFTIALSRNPTLPHEESTKRLLIGHHAINHAISAACPLDSATSIEPLSDPFSITGVWYVIAVKTDSSTDIGSFACWSVTITPSSPESSYDVSTVYYTNHELDKKRERNSIAKFSDSQMKGLIFHVSMPTDGSVKKYKVVYQKSYVHDYALWEVEGGAESYSFVVSHEPALSDAEKSALPESLKAYSLINNKCPSALTITTVSTQSSLILNIPMPNSTRVSKTSKSIEDSVESDEKEPDHSLFGNISRTLNGDASRPSISISLILFWFLYLCFN